MLHEVQGKTLAANSGLTFLVTVYPIVNRLVSKQNRIGVGPEDTRYWTGQCIHRRMNSETISILEVAMKIERQFLPICDRLAHDDAIVNHRGPFVGNHGHFLFTAYKQYAYVLSRILSLPICRSALMSGWLPVIIVKDCIVQMDS